MEGLCSLIWSVLVARPFAEALSCKIPCKCFKCACRRGLGGGLGLQRPDRVEDDGSIPSVSPCRNGIGARQPLVASAATAPYLARMPGDLLPARRSPPV